MAQKIFISYNFSDRIVNELVQCMMQKILTHLDGLVVFVIDDVSYNGPSAITWEVARLMDECDAALFILGENPHNSPWLEHEVECALSKGLSILLTQLPQTNAGTPDLLANTNCVKVGWNANEIIACLNKPA
ncbi:MAG: toll/interleukin-1 receptor domain-containing protein [Algicola sp.]|nr:toll/interleukin-1 receptor domain-containing protein [Algicola sp.]